MPSQGAPFGLSHSAVVLMHFISRQAPHPPGQSHVVSDSVGSENGKGSLGGLSVGCGCLDYIGHEKKMTFIMSVGAIEPFSYVGTHLSTRGTQRSCWEVRPLFLTLSHEWISYNNLMLP